MVPAYRTKDEYAVSTFLFEDVALEEALKAIAEEGFTRVELWGDIVHLDPRMNPDNKQVARLLRALGLHAHALHTPFRRFQIFADEHEGRAWREQLWKRSLDIASELEVPVAVIHAMNRNEYNYGYDQVAYLQELLARLNAYALSRGVTLAVENIPSGKQRTDEVLCTLAEQVKLFANVPDVHWCLDIGHVTITSNDMQGEIDACIDKLVTLHIHNNDGLADSHDIPTKGVIDWPHWYDYLRSNGYEGTFVLEVHKGKDPFGRLKELAGMFEG